MAESYGSFADLPPDMRKRISEEIMPSDPEQWVRQPLATLGGHSFLATLNGPGGDSAIQDYFAQVASQESTWTKAVDSAVESANKRPSVTWRWRVLMLVGAAFSLGAVAAGGGGRSLFFGAAALACYTGAFVSRNL